MTKKEAQEFVNRMREVGDEWTVEDVMSIYGRAELEESITDRKACLEAFDPENVKVALGEK